MKVWLVRHGNKAAGVLREMRGLPSYTDGHSAGQFPGGHLPSVIVVDWGCEGAQQSLFTLDRDDRYQHEGEDLPIYREVTWVLIKSTKQAPIG